MFATMCAGLVMLITTGASPAAPPTTPAWQPLMWWLPEDTETVIVATGPLTVSRLDEKAQWTPEDLVWLPIGAVFDIRDGSVRSWLTGRKIVCAVEGSRRYKAPRGSGGSTKYEGCHIIQVDATSAERLGLAFDSCLRFADKQIELAGQKVAEFRIKGPWDEQSLYVTRPRRDIMICATDLAYLEDTLKRAKNKAERRALPAELPEWNHVDAKASVWAVRHYRKEMAARDESSPLHVGRSAVSIANDSAATGFVFWYTPGVKISAQARYLSKSGNAFAFVQEGWIHDALPKFKPTIDPSKPGVVAISAPLDKDNASGFVFVLNAYLGHAFYP